jgi:hypothetical protein
MASAAMLDYQRVTIIYDTHLLSNMVERSNS